MYEVILGKRSSQVMLHAWGDPAAGDSAEGRAQSLALEKQLWQGDREEDIWDKGGWQERMLCSIPRVA